MRSQTIFRSLSSSLAYSLLAWGLATAAAQSGVGVSPPRVEVAATAGSEVTRTVSVDNPSPATPLDVSVVMTDALMGPGGELIWLDPGSHPGSLAPWLSVNPLEFTLAPAENRAVSYTVSVPADAPDGTYWTVLFFDSAVPGAEERAGAGIGIVSRVRVGHFVYVDVGEPSREGSIVGLRYDPGSEAPPSVRVQFSNRGTGLLRLTGSVEVRDAGGALVRSVGVEGEASFPGATHDIEFPLPSPLPAGSYTLLAVLDYGDSSVLLGEAAVEVP